MFDTRTKKAIKMMKFLRDCKQRERLEVLLIGGGVIIGNIVRKVIKGEQLQKCSQDFYPQGRGASIEKEKEYLWEPLKFQGEGAMYLLSPFWPRLEQFFNQNLWNLSVFNKIWNKK